MWPLVWPSSGMGIAAKLIAFSFDYLAKHPDFVALLNEENRLGAGHARLSAKLPEMHSRFVSLLTETLAQGVREGCFRSGVDAMQLYISIVGLTYFYLSNQHTLSLVFGRSLTTTKALNERLSHVIEYTLGYLVRE